jgi:hypothetical protein
MLAFCVAANWSALKFMVCSLRGFVAMQQFEQHEAAKAMVNPHFRVRSPIGHFSAPRRKKPGARPEPSLKQGLCRCGCIHSLHLELKQIWPKTF